MKTKSLPTQKSSMKLLPWLTMDSLAHTTPVDLEIINENWVVVDSEIVNKTTSMAGAWIRQRTQPLLSHKSSIKTESLPTQKSSTKLLSWLTHGFVSAYNPYWLRNRQRKLSRYQLRNHQWNYFHGWQMDSLAHTAPVDLEIINEIWVVVDSEIVNKTASMADAWIRQRTQPCCLINRQRKLSRYRLKNYQRNCFHGWRMDSSAHTTFIDS